MAREEATDKTMEQLIGRTWEIAKNASVATLITIEDNQAIARPMGSKVDDEAGVIRFLTSADSRKAQQARGVGIPATVFCAHGNGYASFVGTMTVSDDRATIKELWSAFDKAWWESADDPCIRLVTFRPIQAELWDGPNKLTTAALMLSAAITGSQPKVGDHAQVSVR